jgi:hypothetical protein
MKSIILLRDPSEELAILSDISSGMSRIQMKLLVACLARETAWNGATAALTANAFD